MLIWSDEACRLLAGRAENLGQYSGEYVKADTFQDRQYVAAPDELANNVKALNGDPGYFRLRVGDWRVVFREDGIVIAIIRIAPRGGVYD